MEGISKTALIDHLNSIYPKTGDSAEVKRQLLEYLIYNCTELNALLVGVTHEDIRVLEDIFIDLEGSAYTKGGYKYDGLKRIISKMKVFQEGNNNGRN